MQSAEWMLRNDTRTLAHVTTESVLHNIFRCCVLKTDVQKMHVYGAQLAKKHQPKNHGGLHVA